VRANNESGVEAALPTIDEFAAYSPGIVYVGGAESMRAVLSSHIGAAGLSWWCWPAAIEPMSSR